MTTKIDEFIEDNQLLQSKLIYKDILKVSKPTFYRMIKDGRFPQGFKMNTGYRWHIQTVKDWLEAQQLP